MSNLNTELMSALLKNDSIEEVFRFHLEAAMNNLSETELTEFSGYEKSSPSAITAETAATVTMSEISILFMESFISKFLATVMAVLNNS